MSAHITTAEERQGGFAIAGTDAQITPYKAEIAELRAALASQSVAVPACRNQGGVCACRSGGSYGGCALERGITHQSIAPQPPAVKEPAPTNARDTYAAMSPEARAAADLQMAVTEQALQNARASRDRRVTSMPVDIERRHGDRRESGKE